MVIEMLLNSDIPKKNLQMILQGNKCDYVHYKKLIN